MQVARSACPASSSKRSCRYLHEQSALSDLGRRNASDVTRRRTVITAESERQRYRYRITERNRCLLVSCHGVRSTSHLLLYQTANSLCSRSVSRCPEKRFEESIFVILAGQLHRCIFEMRESLNNAKTFPIRYYISSKKQKSLDPRALYSCTFDFITDALPRLFCDSWIDDVRL